MLTEFFTSPQTIAVASKRGAALLDLVSEIIARGQRTGEFSPRIDPQLAATSFFAIAASFISGHVLEGRELSQAEIQRQFLQLTFTGLGPAGGEEP